MRHLSGIFLFCAVTVSFLSLFSYSYLEFRLHRSETKERTSHAPRPNNLIQLAIHSVDANLFLHWEHEHEFMLHGHSYDVFEKHAIGDSTYYLVWWDKEETALRQQLDQLLIDFAEQDPSRQSKQQRLNDFFKKLYFKKNFAPVQIEPALAGVTFPDKTHHIYLINISPPSPPP